MRELSIPSTFRGNSPFFPKTGKSDCRGEQRLTWHALDSKLFNIKLFRFASSLQKQVYGVLFWAVTLIDSPEEMKNVRLSVGSNAASMWWLNGEETGDAFRRSTYGQRRLPLTPSDFEEGQKHHPRRCHKRSGHERFLFVFWMKTPNL